MPEQADIFVGVCLAGDACIGWVAAGQHGTVRCHLHPAQPYEPRVYPEDEEEPDDDWKNDPDPEDDYF